MKHHRAGYSVAVVLAWLCFGDTRAQEADPASLNLITESVIQGSGRNNGTIAVNSAAGNFNTQANSAAIAISENGGSANAFVGITQHISSNRGSPPNVAITRIDGGAFSNASGLIMINQASGVANAQANGAAIALGIDDGTVVAETALRATVSDNGLADVDQLSDGAIQQVGIDPTAFVGTRGLVQINQAAGVGNTTANNFALSVSLGANP